MLHTRFPRQTSIPTREAAHVSSPATVALFIAILAFIPSAHAEEAALDDRYATLFFSPHAQTVLVGTTFDASIFLNTHGVSVNAIDLDIAFSPDTLAIVRPTGTSFVSVWRDPPRFSNTAGTAHFAGAIPTGITTEGSLFITLTFKAQTAGEATITVLPSSRVTASVTGENLLTVYDKVTYAVHSKPHEGVRVFSPTHRVERDWHNNNSPVLTWEKGEGVTDFSFALDNKPQTVPDNKPETTDTITSYEDLADGLWYFHIKARKTGMWGNTTHFPLRIDTTPPLPFKVEIETLTAIIINRSLVTFNTIDELSGIDHFEIGIIDRERSPLESPAFFQADSPYQLPTRVSSNLRVITRAVDRAGNIQTASADVSAPSKLQTLPILALVVILLFTAVHYVRGYRLTHQPTKAYMAPEDDE